MRLILSFLLALCIGAKAATPSQLLSSASALQGLSTRDLEITEAYSLAIAIGGAAIPVGSLLANAYSAGFAGLSDKDLQVIQAYAASQAIVAIYVSPNTNSPTYGIQEALNSISKNGSYGTNVIQARLRLAPGDYYFTNNIFYSNTYPVSIRIEGASILGTRLIYAGNTTTNCIFFTGGGNPAGGALNLPIHLEIADLTITSITNGQQALLCVTNYSYFDSERVNYTGWQVTTNVLWGAGLSLTAAPANAQGNVGVVVGCGNEHGTFFRNCFFAGLATGVECWADHLYMENAKFACIGVFGIGPTDGTAWANTSPYSLGAAILRRPGLDTHIFRAHFYICNGGVVLDNPTIGLGCGSVLIAEPQFELADHPLAANAPAGQAIFIPSENATDLATVYSVAHGPYAYNTTTTMDIRYTLSNKLLVSLNGNNAVATNFARLSQNTNTCSQPAAGFSPNLSAGVEFATTNTGPVVFTTASVAGNGAGDYSPHIVWVRNTGASDQPIIIPAPYRTNIAGTVLRVTNVTKLTIDYWAGTASTTNVFSQPQF